MFIAWNRQYTKGELNIRLPFTQGKKHWLLQAYKDPECLVQVLVGEIFSRISNDHAVWVGLVNTVKLRENSCRRVKT